jgi:hypothetical protein
VRFVVSAFKIQMNVNCPKSRLTGSDVTFGTVYLVNEKNKSSATILLVFLIALAIGIPSITTFWVLSPSLYENTY